jgi:hypothetical protein
LNTQARRLLRRAKQVAARGRAMDGDCFELKGLNALHFSIADLDYLVDNWVKPQLAVSPAPRVPLTDAATQEIAERLANMPSS